MRYRCILLCFLLLLGVTSARAQSPLTRLQLGGHSGPVNQIAVSKDGTFLVSASDDGTVKLWRCADNSLVATFVTRAWNKVIIKATSVAITGDNSFVIAGDVSGVMWVWRTSDFKLVKKSTIFDPNYAQSKGVTALDCASDGSLVAVAGVDALAGYCIKLIRLSDGKKIRTLTGHSALINHVAFALNKPTALGSSAYDNSVRVWDASTGTTKLNVTSAFNYDGTGSGATFYNAVGAYCVAMSADGAYVAASGADGGNAVYPYWYATVKVWSATTSTPTIKMKATTSNVTAMPIISMAFSRDKSKITVGCAGYYSYIAAGRFSNNNAVVEYQVSTGNQIAKYRVHDNDVLSIAYSLNGASIYSSGYDWQIRQYISGSTDYSYVTQFYGAVYGASASPDGNTLAVAHIPYNLIQAFGVNYWAGGAGNAVDLRSNVDGTLLQSLYGGTGPLAFSSDSALFACGSYTAAPWGNSSWQPYADTIHVLDLTQNALEILSVPGANSYGAMTNVWFDPDPLAPTIYAASYYGNQITALDTGDGSILNSYQQTNVTGGWGYAASSDGAFTAIYDANLNQFSILRVADMSIVKQVSGRPGDSYIGGRVALSPNAAYLAYTYNPYRNNVRIIRVSDGRAIGNVSYSYDKPINIMTFSPQGDTLALYYDSAGTVPTVSMFQLSGRKIGSWTEQLGTGLASLNFTPSGDEVLLGRQDGTLLVCAKMNLVSLKAFSLDLPTAAGGVESRTATVTLTGVSPLGGTLVLLSSSDTTVATVPDSVVVPAGSKSVTFNVVTKAVTAPAPVNLYAVCGALLQTVLTVNPVIAIKGVSVSPSLVQGGMTATGVVSLKSPAYAGGVLVALTSSVPGVVTVPATVLVPQGKKLFVSQTP